MWNDFSPFGQRWESGDIYFTPVRGEYFDNRVCLSVLSVCPSAHMSQKLQSDFTKMYVHVTVAVARSSSDDNAIRHVLSVLWITSCFQIMERMGQSQSQRVCFVQFARWRHAGEVCLLRLHLVVVLFGASAPSRGLHATIHADSSRSPVSKWISILVWCREFSLTYYKWHNPFIFWVT